MLTPLFVRVNNQADDTPRARTVRARVRTVRANGSRRRPACVRDELRALMRGPERPVESDFEVGDGPTVRPGTSGEQVREGRVVHVRFGGDRSLALRAHDSDQPHGEEAHLLGGGVGADRVRPVVTETGWRWPLGSGHDLTVGQDAENLAQAQPACWFLPTDNTTHNVRAFWEGVGMNQHRDFVRRTVDQTLEQFQPRNLPLARWLAVADFVRETVALSQAPSADECRRRMGVLARLAIWVHFEAGHPLDVAHVLHPDLIAEWFDQVVEVSAQVKSMERARVLRVARKTNPAFPTEEPATSRYPSSWEPKPYTAREVVLIKDWWHTQRTEQRRETTALLLALALGAGLNTFEVVRVRARDITVDDLGVLVTVHEPSPRQVPVLAEWEEPLRVFAAVADPDWYVFAPGRHVRNASTVTSFLAGCNSDSGLRPMIQRARATWIVNHIIAGVPIADIAFAAGLRTLGQYARWVYAATGRSASTHYRALLRAEKAQ